MMNTSLVPWLTYPKVDEFTASVPRELHPDCPITLCGATPAKAFVGWCHRKPRHDGNHALTQSTADRMDKWDRLRSR